MGFTERTFHEYITENVRDDQRDIIAYLNNETWWEERPDILYPTLPETELQNHPWWEISAPEEY